MFGGHRGAPKWAPAAALLNLSGLGVGYLYLGRYWRAATFAMITALLVLTGFLTDASSWPWPWRVVAVLWPLAGAFDGWRLGRWHPRPWRIVRRVLPAVLGTLLVGLLIVGDVFYVHGANAFYADGLAAQRRADCPVATDIYNTVTGPFELSLSDAVPAAERDRALCAEFTVALDAERRADFPTAVRRYAAFRGAHPGSPLATAVHHNLERSYRAWAAMLRGQTRYGEAVRVYRKLRTEAGGEPLANQVSDDIAATYLDQAALRRVWLAGGRHDRQTAAQAVRALLRIRDEHPDSPAAAAVPQAFADTYHAALDGVGDCTAVPLLNYFVGLPSARTAGVVGLARRGHPRALYGCAIRRYRATDFDTAIDHLNRIVTAYPHSRQARGARSALISAKVSRGAGRALPLPAPGTGPSPGSIQLTFYNDSTEPAHVLLTGPNAHEFGIAPCGGCRDEYRGVGSGCGSTAGKPSATLYLRPGRYHFLVDHTGSDVDDLSDSIKVEPAFTYTECLYISSR